MLSAEPAEPVIVTLLGDLDFADTARLRDTSSILVPSAEGAAKVANGSRKAGWA